MARLSGFQCFSLDVCRHPLMDVCRGFYSGNLYRVRAAALPGDNDVWPGGNSSSVKDGVGVRVGQRRAGT